jgi:Serum amyloid A protein
MAEWLSDAREWYGQSIKGDPIVDSNADQIANRSGRVAGQLGIEPSARPACAYFPPRGLPSRY